MNGSDKQVRAKSALVMIVLGLIFLGMFGYEWWLADEPEGFSEAEEVSLGELLLRWPKGNTHIRLTGFVLGKGHYTEKRVSRRQPWYGSWRETWLPAYTESAGDAGKAPALLVVKVPVSSEEELRQAYQQRPVTVTVVGDLSQVEPAKQKELRDKLKLDPNALPLILREVEKAPDKTYVKVLFGLGALLVVLGVLWALLILNYRPPPAVPPPFFPNYPPR
jgi:hypothetical protein